MGLTKHTPEWRLQVLQEALKTGNVADTCKKHGMDRTTFYKLKARCAGLPEGEWLAALQDDPRKWKTQMNFPTRWWPGHWRSPPRWDGRDRNGWDQPGSRPPKRARPIEPRSATPVAVPTQSPRPPVPVSRSGMRKRSWEGKLAPRTGCVSSHFIPDSNVGVFDAIAWRSNGDEGDDEGASDVHGGSDLAARIRRRWLDA